jgi:hypothetical protein
MSFSRTILVSAAAVATLVSVAARAEDLASSVAARLRDSGALAGYRVNVRAKSGTVWLEGRVADQKQLATALSLAETSPGVERVVNRLVIDGPRDGGSSSLALPTSAWSMLGMAAPSAAKSRPAPPAGGPAVSAQPGGPRPDANGKAVGKNPAGFKLVQAVTPASQGRSSRREPVRTAGLPGVLPAPGGYEGPLVDGQMVPGSMRFSEGMPGGVGGYGDGGAAYGGGEPGGYGYGGGPGGPGGYAGGTPMPMAGTGAGMPPVPMRGDGPNMPNYAWPSYAASPNYAALQYPTQYSPTAWPYIGPFYPYPQVPLGWRRVSLEWDDGWWWLDFDDRHIHRHHR